MSSKCRLLSTLCYRPIISKLKNGFCYPGIRFCCQRQLQFQSSNMTISSRSCLTSNPGLTIEVPYCGCGVRKHSLLNTPAFYATSISRHYVSTSSPESEQPEKKPSLYQRFKTMYRDYWYVLAPVHLVTSAAWFGSFYYMASSGVDIVALLEKLNVSEKVINPFRNGHSTTGYLAISYALYKIATPLRYTVTLGGTTVSIKFLTKKGYIKPMPSKEKLKEIYHDQKDILKEKGQTLKDNMMQTLKPSEN